MESTEGRPDSDRAQFGAVYTPANLALWVAKQLRSYAETPLEHVLDPACGSGALLRAVGEQIPEVIRLSGYDLSAPAVGNAKLAFADNSELNPLAGKADFRIGDSLLHPLEDFGDVDGVIMNPPWGGKLGVPIQELTDGGYTLANGQFDTWDLFIEWSLKRLRPGATVAAIVPDAVFLPEHAATRELLVRSADLRLIARLGEGWFRGVYRGTVVVVFNVGRHARRSVTCIRLAHDRRKQVLRGELSLDEATEATEQVADQDTWAQDKNVRFILPSAGRSSGPLDRIDQLGADWSRLTKIGRGVEIGKSGRLLTCTHCGWHIPPPQSAKSCPRCKRADSWEPIRAVAREASGSGWIPLIVGEDVKRHSASPSRWLQLGLDGVQYKDPAIYAQPKLVVRKTGLGLNAAIDRTGSHTTQVVYHFTATASAPDFYLDYVAGVLCSRVMLAYHLASSGETEWRSHPYVTPKVLKGLPIPVPEEGSGSWRQAKAIAEAARAIQVAENPLHEDLRLDRLVAGLYGLDHEACRWVTETIAATEDLQAFSSLKLVAGFTIEPELAA